MASVGRLNYSNTGGAVNIRGFAGGVPGQLFGFANRSGFNVTLLHMDGTAPELAARVYCPGAVNLAGRRGDARCWCSTTGWAIGW